MPGNTAYVCSMFIYVGDGEDNFLAQPKREWNIYVILHYHLWVQLFEKKRKFRERSSWLGRAKNIYHLFMACR